MACACWRIIGSTLATVLAFIIWVNAATPIERITIEMTNSIRVKPREILLMGEARIRFNNDIAAVDAE